jgi:hypothetical protein
MYRGRIDIFFFNAVSAVILHMSVDRKPLLTFSPIQREWHLLSSASQYFPHTACGRLMDESTLDDDPSHTKLEGSTIEEHAQQYSANTRTPQN